MATNANKILAGTGAGGTGTSLAWVGTQGTATAPANATATLATFHDLGFCTTDGLTVSDSITSNTVTAFGTTTAVRVIKTSEQKTFHVAGLESSTYMLEVYNGLAVGSLTPSSGAFSITDSGLAVRQLYAFVFDMVDGTNHIRVYLPNCEVTDKDSVQIQEGQPVQYGVTLTPYPDPTLGYASKWFYVVAADVS